MTLATNSTKRINVVKVVAAVTARVIRCFAGSSVAAASRRRAR
jgi:hypothetical protein